MRMTSKAALQTAEHGAPPRRSQSLFARLRRAFAAAAIAIVLLFPGPSAAQAVYDRNAPKEPGARTWVAAKAKLPRFTPPRMRDGKPNLEGRWGPSSSGDDIEETAYIDITTPPAESWIADPPDGKVPYQPWALAEWNAHQCSRRERLLTPIVQTGGESGMLRRFDGDAEDCGQRGLSHIAVARNISDVPHQPALSP